MYDNVTVTVIVKSSGKSRSYGTYEDFIRDYRFFCLSGDDRSKCVGSIEYSFLEILEFLRSMGKSDIAIGVSVPRFDIIFKSDNQHNYEQFCEYRKN